MKSIIAALVLFVFTSSPLVCQQPVDAATKEDVEKSFELSGTREALQSMWTAMAQNRAAMAEQSYKQKNPQASPAEVQKVALAAAQNFEDATKSFSYDDMLAIIVPVYQRYFTHSDVVAINDFYATPVGQKVIKNTPAMMADGMQALRPILLKRLAECFAQAEKPAIGAK
jgi:hypothetical protein